MARRRGQRKGYLRKDKSGNWLLTYRVDTLEGRRKVTFTVGRYKGPDAIGSREAERIAWDEYLSKVDSSSMRPGSMRSFQEFVENRFNPDVVDKLKPGGKIHYELLLRKHILPLLGSKTLRDITPSLIQSLLNSKLKENLSTQTVVHIRNAVSAVMRHARRMECFTGQLPTEELRLPTMRRKERTALTWDQVVTIAKALPEPISVLVLFLTLTGLRISEAMGLRWKWVNLSDSPKVTDGMLIDPFSLAVMESYRYGSYQTVKSAKSRRIVPIPMWFVPLLLTLRSTASTDTAVFVNGNGNAPLDAHNISNRILRPTLAKLGLKGFSFHSLRHTNATLGDQAGLTITQRQRVHGHASTEMQMLYTHVDLDQMRPIIEAMVDPKKLN